MNADLIENREVLCLPHLTALRLAGTDTAEFLDRQLTAPATGLAVGEARLACWCDPKGRVIAPLWLIRTDQQAFCMILATALAGTVQHRLALYVLRDDVRVQPVSASECVAGVESAEAAPPHAWPVLTWRPTARLTVVDSSFARVDPSGVAAWRRADIEHGLPWLDQATTQRFLPQALGMERWRAIDYNKGCYPGQEVISRTHYLGRLKRGLWRVQVEVAEAAVPGTEVNDSRGHALGHLLDAVHSEPGAAALAVLHDTCTDKVLSLGLQEGEVRVQLRHRVESETSSE